MVIKLGLYDVDFFYALSVLEYVNSLKNTRYTVSVFSSESALREYLEDHTLDVILINEVYNTENYNAKVVKLSDKRNQEGCIFKYQSVLDILAKLELDEKNEAKKYEFTGLIGIYSPVGRCGKTNLSLAIGRSCKNAIYLNLEEYSSIGLEMLDCVGNESESDIKGLNDKIFYYLMTENKELISYLGRCPKLKKYNNLKMISWVNNYGDTKLVTADKLKWFWEVLENTGEYDALIVDIGAGAINDLSVLSVFDVVYVPLVKESISTSKLTRFGKWISSEGCNYKKVYLPNVDYMNDQLLTAISNI